MTTPGIIPVGKSAWALLFTAGLTLLGASSLRRAVISRADWPTFDWDLARTGAPAPSMGVTAANVASMQRQQVAIDGTVDASAIYLHAVTVHGAAHDVFFVTTTYGKTLAIDADRGTILWEFTPPGYATVAGSRQITTATPVADPDRASIYAAASDGSIRKLAIADGSVLWTTPITRLPTREKIASALTIFRGRVIATTGGYIGDAPPYQGHVAILDAATGRLLHIWNSLCSDRLALIDPASCHESDSAIWGRAGAVIDSTSGNIFVATGNATWDGKTNWGDAVIELDPDATHILGNYTPENTAQLNDDDADLGSTSPVLLGGGLVLQGGKDALIRILDWSRMAGTAPHKGGEASSVATPSNTRLFTAPAAWKAGGTQWILAADNGATTAWTLHGTQLHQQWQSAHGGTSPVIVDGMAFVYDPHGGLRVYDATSGKEITTLECGGGHWNSPIVVDGRIALPEGNANAHQTTGVLDIWRVGS
ncbi:MAG TPA: PQQ-binding-like beta-propeller repeat protein [Gemmatimonadales bacterium]|jgi:outer membrane protein assembly factor BamB